VKINVVLFENMVDSSGASEPINQELARPYLGPYDSLQVAAKGLLNYRISIPVYIPYRWFTNVRNGDFLEGRLFRIEGQPFFCGVYSLDSNSEDKSGRLFAVPMASFPRDTVNIHKRPRIISSIGQSQYAHEPIENSDLLVIKDGAISLPTNNIYSEHALNIFGRNSDALRPIKELETKRYEFNEMDKLGVHLGRVLYQYVLQKQETELFAKDDIRRV
jgi:hypothetical protein